MRIEIAFNVGKWAVKIILRRLCLGLQSAKVVESTSPRKVFNRKDNTNFANRQTTGIATR